MRVFVAGASGAIGTTGSHSDQPAGWRDGFAAAYGPTSKPEPEPVGGRKP